MSMLNLSSYQGFSGMGLGMGDVSDDLSALENESIIAGGTDPSGLPLTSPASTAAINQEPILTPAQVAALPSGGSMSTTTILMIGVAGLAAVMLMGKGKR
jgi:hypothetical protein